MMTTYSVEIRPKGLKATNETLQLIIAWTTRDMPLTLYCADFIEESGSKLTFFNSAQ